MNLRLNRRTLFSRALATPFALAPAVRSRNQPTRYSVSGLDLHKLDPTTLIFNRPVVVPIRVDDSVDDFGVPMRKEDDGTMHDQVVTQAQYLLRMLSNYSNTADNTYLEIAIRVGDRIFENRHEIEGAYYFPYEFDYMLSGNPAGRLEAPWYSGMAQGHVLQSFIRLWLATKEDRWWQRAERTAESFRKVDHEAAPNIMRVNDRGELWIEEYPDSTYLETLNGHIFGYLGLYEYWCHTDDKECATILDGALTTILNSVDSRIRVPGQPSHYSVNQPSQPDGYHVVHTSQILESYRITNDPRFADLAVRMHVDFPPYTIKGTLHVPAGEYTLHEEERTKPHLILKTPVKVAFERDQQLLISQRRRLWDREDVFYQFVDDDGTARWIKESQFVRLTGEYLGPVDLFGPLTGTRMEFDPPVRMMVNSGVGEQVVGAISMHDGARMCEVAETGFWEILEINLVAVPQATPQT